MPMESSNNSSFYGGITLLVLGTLFLLDNMDILDFGHFISTFWPIIFIIIGIHLIVKVRKDNAPDAPENRTGTSNVNPISTDKIVESNLFGDLKLNISSGKFKGGSISNVFGDIKVDMTACSMEPGNSRLNVNGVFGDVSIYLPAGVGVKADFSAVAGDITVEGTRREGLFPRIAHQDQNYSENAAKLEIHGSIIFGSIRINRK